MLIRLIVNSTSSVICTRSGIIMNVIRTNLNMSSQFHVVSKLFLTKSTRVHPDLHVDDSIVALVRGHPLLPGEEPSAGRAGYGVLIRGGIGRWGRIVLASTCPGTLSLCWERKVPVF